VSIEAARLAVVVTADTSAASRALRGAGDDVEGVADRADRAGSRFGGAMAKMGGLAAAGLAGVAVGAAAFGKQAMDAASNQAESLGKVNVVFGASGKAIEAWASGSAKNFGQSKTAALEAVGTYGNLLQAFGLSQDKAAGMSKTMVELASDLASFNNTSVEDALAALQSGLSGESEPLKRYGVALSEARLKEEALAQGLIKSTKEALTPAMKSQATYGLILKDTTLAQGDFARTADGVANKQRIMSAQWDDAKAKIGQALLPVMEALIPVLEKIATWLGEYLPPAIEATRQFIEEKLIPAFKAIAEWIDTYVVPAVQRAAEIVTAVVQGISDVVRRVVDVVTGLWRKFGDDLVQFTRGAWDFIVGVIRVPVEIIKGIIKTAVAIVKGDWGAAWDAMRDMVVGVWDAIVGAVQGAWNMVSGAVRIGTTIVRDVLKAAMDGVQTAWSTAWDVFTKPIDAAWSFVKKIVDFIESAIRKLIGWLEDMADKAVGVWERIKNPFKGDVKGGINLGGGSTAGGVAKSAAGRYVNSPMISSLGEGGRPELVLPLTDPSRSLALLAEGAFRVPGFGKTLAGAMTAPVSMVAGGGATIVTQVTYQFGPGSIVIDHPVDGFQLVEELARYTRGAGPLPGSITGV
jgi:hypothetical protein